MAKGKKSQWMLNRERMRQGKSLRKKGGKRISSRRGKRK